MTQKSFIVTLGVSIAIWYISRYIVVLYEIFILNDFKINIFGDSCLSTGYPVYSCVDNNLTLIVLSIVNIIIWYGVIWAVLKMIRSK